MESTSNYDIIRHLHGLDLVKLMLGKRDQMEALAEEAAELSWAALKWIRASGMSANPTTEDFHQTANNLIEEFRDVLACAYVAGLRIPTEEELKQRSSMGCKKHLMLSNTVGIIDSDYYNNPDNEGNIIIAIYNYGDRAQHIDVGDKVAQGIFLKFGITADDATAAKEERRGGIGSTGE